MVAGPGTPLAAAQVTSGDLSAAVAAESPANRAIEIREGGLPLQVGSQGDLVAQVQRELHVDEDGIFGVQTDAAVRSYQQAKGLDVDGIVGLATWGSLFPGQTQGGGGARSAGRTSPPRRRQQVEQTVEQAGQPARRPGRHRAVRHGGRHDRHRARTPRAPERRTTPVVRIRLPAPRP